jgi:hypothetical protein
MAGKSPRDKGNVALHNVAASVPENRTAGFKTANLRRR